MPVGQQALRAQAVYKRVRPIHDTIISPTHTGLTLGAGGLAFGGAALGIPIPGPGPTPPPIGNGKTAIRSPWDCLPFISSSSASSLWSWILLSGHDSLRGHLNITY
jgi:hypothetical protein